MNITKDLKRLISIATILVMIISTFTVMAEDKPIITVSSQQIYLDGEATITITVDKPLDISSLNFKLKYDNVAFTVTPNDITFSDKLSTELAIPPAIVKDDIISFVGAKGSNISLGEPFTIATIKFKATNAATVKVYPLLVNDVLLGNFIGDAKLATEIPTTIVPGSITIARRSSGGGGGSSTPTPSPTVAPSPSPTVSTAPTPTPAPAVVNVEVKSVVADGKSTSAVTEAAANTAITEALATATKDKTTSEVKINVETSTEVVTTVETSIKESTMTALKSKSVDNVTVSTQLVDVSFDKPAIAVISDNTKNDVSLSVEKVNNTTLSEEAQSKVGDNPVYDFNLTSNGKKISNFQDGLAKITIPYVLKDNQLAKDIVVYYIKDDGTLEQMKNVKYDEKLKAAVFYTSHFSKFALAFKEFSDVSGWSEEFIYFLADKGIVNGKAEGIFAPDDNITRAEFVAIIARSVGVTADDATAKAEYSDVAVTEWFAPYVSWAKEKGIVSGYEDGSFAPNKEITREELCAMIVRTLAAYKMAPDKAELTFADANVISDWAKESIASLAKLGVVSGKGDNKFAPADNATRAESAKIITGMYKILNSIK